MCLSHKCYTNLCSYLHISFPFQSKPKDDAAIRKKTDAPSPDVKEEEEEKEKEEEKEEEKPGDQSFVAEDEGEEVRARLTFLVDFRIAVLCISLIYILRNTFFFRNPHLWRGKKKRKRKQARGKERLVRAKLAKRRAVRVREREARRREKLARRMRV